MLFDFDSFTGIKEEFRKDQMTGQIEIKKSQNVDGIFNANQAEKNANSSGWKGEFHKVASIPLIIIDQWREELKAKGSANPDPLATENRSFLIAKINSSEFSKIRTKEGRV